MNQQYTANGEGRLLEELGGAVRSSRLAQKLTLRALAAKSGVSERFLAELEAGRGNVSVLNLERIASALDTRPSRLLAQAEESKHVGTKRRESAVVSLVGLRGAGKSTIGRLAAGRLGVPFYELDELVAIEAGMDLQTIFEIHGDAYFRKIELQALKRLLHDAPLEGGVIAAGGSIVTSEEAYELLLAKTTVVWLAARAQDHWDRVVAQGDVRPMKNRANAMTELKGLLRERKPLYARAHHKVQTSGVPTMRVVDRVVRAAYEGANGLERAGE